MAADQQHYLVRAWYQKSPLLYFLLPLTLLFFVITTLRRLAYRAGIFSSYRPSVPVIVVGNITVGGTGKTPVVIALVEALKQAGFSPAIVSRGYGSKAPAYPYLVNVDSSPEHAGDEPLLMAIRTQVPVMIAANRSKAVAKLLAEHSVNVIISDDGLQHYALQRDIEIVVVDAERGLANGFLLPVGPLRELSSRLASVDYVLLNGSSSNTLSSNATNTVVNNSVRHSAMALIPQNLQPLKGGEAVPIEHWSYPKKVHALAGIGNPQRFFHTLRQLGFEPREHSFDDHHVYQAKDLQFNDAWPVIMTEKDAVKIRAIDTGDNYWFLPVVANFDDAFIPFLLQKLSSLTQQYSRNNKA